MSDPRRRFHPSELDIELDAESAELLATARDLETYAATGLAGPTAGFEDRVIEFEDSSATVELAAERLGCEPAHIAKTLAFAKGDGCVCVVCAGDARVNNQKFKARFHSKPGMLKAPDVLRLVGYPVGGVCPFGVNEGVPVYLDESLKRFDVVYPAAGNARSAVRLTPAELEEATENQGWVDVCRVPGQ